MKTNEETARGAEVRCARSIGEELPVVAIVGRPNVGKSSLFNRLVGSRKALVRDVPGVTRDRIEGEVDWAGRSFGLFDTGGLDPSRTSGRLAAKIRRQIEKAIDEADLLVFVVDGRVEVHPLDEEIARALRETRKPVVCAVNKIDNPAEEGNLYSYYRLGFDPLLPVSAEHGLGIDALLDRIVENLPATDRGLAEERDGARPVRVAVVGRPNVGKSTFVNALLGEERLLVDEEPGTTRDAVDTLVVWKGRRYVLADTAGIRRKGKVRSDLEKFAVGKALQRLDRCDVALLMLDAQEGVTDQDAHIGGYILERGRAVVVLANKWDLVAAGPREAKRRLEGIRSALVHLPFAPVLAISARTGLNLVKVFPTVDRVERAFRTRVPTGPLNRLLSEAVRSCPPPAEGGRQRRLLYATQIQEGPPTFLIFSNLAGDVHFSYERYLVNRLRERFGFEGTPIRLIFRKKRERG